MPTPLYGAAVLKNFEQSGFLIIGGSTGSDFDATATRDIREVPIEGYNGTFENIAQMRVPRTECFAILGGSDDQIVIIGGTEAPIMDIFRYDGYGSFNERELTRIQNNTFAQLCNYTTDIISSLVPLDNVDLSL